MPLGERIYSPRCAKPECRYSMFINVNHLGRETTATASTSMPKAHRNSSKCWAPRFKTAGCLMEKARIFRRGAFTEIDTLSFRSDTYAGPAAVPQRQLGVYVVAAPAAAQGGRANMRASRAPALALQAQHCQDAAATDTTPLRGECSHATSHLSVLRLRNRLTMLHYARQADQRTRWPLLDPCLSAHRMYGNAEHRLRPGEASHSRPRAPSAVGCPRPHPAVRASPVVERRVTEPMLAPQVFTETPDSTYFRNPTIWSPENLDFLMPVSVSEIGLY
jgi:hypothetical protein